ncbi:MAG TPA: ABC transporter substrate-binding protein [Xanthobacteraceae bacterium]|jgi:putative ABC transport system substrate-binding protein|nr:ABC transporter substrate-binding protein [Xanthobacteraceae bacterium]
MIRRQFIGFVGGAAASCGMLAPLALRAQGTGGTANATTAAPAKTRRIGIIVEGMRSAAYDGFLQGMDALGYISGRDYLIEWRFADGRFLRILESVSELAKLNIDLIFVGSPAIVYPVRQATRTIPIVMGYSVDPVGNGFVSSLAHPGGNITGVASTGEDISAKQFGLLAAMVPDLSRVGLLQNPDSSDAAADLKAAQAAAEAGGLHLVTVDARVARDIEPAFQALAKERVQALKVGSDRFLFSEQQRIADLALKAGLPSIFPERAFVEAGGLMSLSESLKDYYRHAATFVDKIFKGARAGDLAIEQLTLLDLVVNRRTAHALGVALPPQGDFAAYEVIG